MNYLLDADPASQQLVTHDESLRQSLARGSARLTQAMQHPALSAASQAAVQQVIAAAPIATLDTAPAGIVRADAMQRMLRAHAAAVGAVEQSFR